MTQTLSPLDGRYSAQVAPLLDYFSEQALNRARLQVEIEWLILLCNGLNPTPTPSSCSSATLTPSSCSSATPTPSSCGPRNEGSQDLLRADEKRIPLIPGAPKLSQNETANLRQIVTDFNDAEAKKLAAIESETKHDVKAIEYYIVNKLADIAPQIPAELVHFAFTSEDVNNLSYALNIKNALQKVWLPAAISLVDKLTSLAQATAEIPMLSRTHGQPASPTTMGKELAVTALRLRRQIARVQNDEILGKSNGATGTFGAHLAGVPHTDWLAVSQAFVTGLGLEWNPVTTQIEPHDWQSEVFEDVARFGRILHNLATDIWTYISLGYFTQIPVPGATGSSTMPHKINPIRFENAEANLEISDALFRSLSTTLVTSRLQRDLTDSTTQRNVGVAFGHSLLAIDNILKGLGQIQANAALMAEDLNNNWEVLAEPIQTVMRAAAVAGVPGMANPYERLKNLSRGHKLTPEDMREFVLSLELPKADEERLLNLTPATYTGIAKDLVDRFLLP